MLIQFEVGDALAVEEDEEEGMTRKGIYRIVNDVVRYAGSLDWRRKWDESLDGNTRSVLASRLTLLILCII